GRKHPAAKALKGFGGAGVLEVVEDHDGKTYRAVYTVKLPSRSTSFTSSRRNPREASRLRLRKSKPSNAGSKRRRNIMRRDEAKTVRQERPEMIEESSGNVFADLDLENPDELLAKVELVQRICDIIAERKLTQTKAAAILGIDRPQLAALMRGRLDDF